MAFNERNCAYPAEAIYEMKLHTQLSNFCHNSANKVTSGINTEALFFVFYIKA
jgi:hypothetical protein